VSDSTVTVNETRTVRLTGLEVMARHGLFVNGDDSSKKSLNDFIWFTAKCWFAIGAGVGASLGIVLWLIELWVNS
jgi:hypothetical protein